MQKQQLNKEIKKGLSGIVSGMSMDKRNLTNLVAYTGGLLKSYTGSFSILQMSGLIGYSYDKLQHLTSHSAIDDAWLNEGRIRWAKEKGLLQDKVDIIIDDTSVRKFVEEPYFIARGYIGNLGKVDKMMSAVFSCFWSEGNLLPFDFKHYISAKKLQFGKDDPAFASKPKLALELIKSAMNTISTVEYVIFDTAYSASWLLEEIYKNKLHYFAGIKSNRIVLLDGRKTCPSKDLAPELRGQVIPIKEDRYMVKSKMAKLKNLGHTVKLFWINNTSSNKEKIYATNDLDMTEEVAAQKHHERAQIDVVFFKIAKSVLLLDEGKFQKLIGYTRHYYFVAIAFSILVYLQKKLQISIFRLKILFNS